MSESANKSLGSTLLRCVSQSKDGYAIFDAQDTLCFSNYVYRDLFCVPQDSSERLGWEEINRRAFEQKRGIKIDADRLEDWLAYISSVRRRRDFRIFEVDLVDGRWFLFSEQLLETGELFVHCKDMTRQKLLEKQLLHSVDNLHRLALTDELTQLANRRCFVESTNAELCRQNCDAVSATMVVMDLDFFKKVNDTYGHAGGDAVLKHIANLLKQTLRQHDIVGRIGGEEFAIFLGETQADTARMITERLRNTIATTPLVFDGEEISVTASFGMAVHYGNVDFEQLYADADDALYRAKSNGRNRIEVYS